MREPGPGAAAQTQAGPAEPRKDRPGVGAAGLPGRSEAPRGPEGAREPPRSQLLKKRKKAGMENEFSALITVSVSWAVLYASPVVSKNAHN